MYFDALPGYGPGETLPSEHERIAKAKELLESGHIRIVGSCCEGARDPYDAVCEEVVGDIRRPDHGVVGPLVLFVEEKTLPTGKVSPGSISVPHGAALWQKAR